MGATRPGERGARSVVLGVIADVELAGRELLERKTELRGDGGEAVAVALDANVGARPRGRAKDDAAGRSGNRWNALRQLSWRYPRTTRRFDKQCRKSGLDSLCCRGSLRLSIGIEINPINSIPSERLLMQSSAVY